MLMVLKTNGIEVAALSGLKIRTDYKWSWDMFFEWFQYDSESSQLNEAYVRNVGEWRRRFLEPTVKWQSLNISK